MADILARAFELWRRGDYARRRVAIGEIARATGYSRATMENSVDALLKPFTSEALTSMAARIASKSRSERPRTVGFIAAGNVAGAGIHEIALALIAGAGLVIKTASSEPVFFAEFARTIAEIDPHAGAHIEVRAWDRSHTELTSTLIAKCELVVAYGDDNTMRSLRRSNVIEFGSRVSAAVIVLGAISPSAVNRVAESLARDVALFEQLGCLSPHQVFVVSLDSNAGRDFAVAMAAALERIGESMPPARIPLRDAAEIRGVRERVRWRAIAGEPVELFEGRGLEWTVVYDRRVDMNEPFKISPGFRTVHVTAMRNIAELRECLASVSGRLEAMAIAGDEAGQIRSAIAAMRIPYVCAPGEMQSPPLDWRHGGGAFIDAMMGAR
ncbi:MAG TPA: acyl-CoA reductase [Candidatus Binatus sp.]|nr:acyl-CoA reductase [Candidatus Binatus sp.]